MDRHLNLFYSYNRDSELIENNLTRALIVTLRMIEPATCDAILRGVFEEPLRNLGYECPSFINSEFALQSNFDRERAATAPHRFVVALASDFIEAIDQESEAVMGLARNTGSVPDAWIAVEQGEHCFLVEAKIGGNPLNDAQLVAHARSWMRIEDHELPRRLISVTWSQVLSVIHDFIGGSESQLSRVNRQEISILTSLFDFIEYAGYRLFLGIDFAKLRPRVNLVLGGDRATFGLALSRLAAPPQFSLSLAGDRH